MHQVLGDDVFTYTLTDGTATSTATLTITVNGNTAPTAVNDTDAVNEDATITRTSGSNLLMDDDSDANGDSITVTQIAVTGGSIILQQLEQVHQKEVVQQTNRYLWSINHCCKWIISVKLWNLDPN